MHCEFKFGRLGIRINLTWNFNAQVSLPYYHKWLNIYHLCSCFSLQGSLVQYGIQSLIVSRKVFEVDSPTFNTYTPTKSIYRRTPQIRCLRVKDCINHFKTAGNYRLLGSHHAAAMLRCLVDLRGCHTNSWTRRIHSARLIWILDLGVPCLSQEFPVCCGSILGGTVLIEELEKCLRMGVIN